MFLFILTWASWKVLCLKQRSRWYIWLLSWHNVNQVSDNIFSTASQSVFKWIKWRLCLLLFGEFKFKRYWISLEDDPSEKCKTCGWWCVYFRIIIQTLQTFIMDYVYWFNLCMLILLLPLFATCLPLLLIFLTDKLINCFSFRFRIIPQNKKFQEFCTTGDKFA